MLLCVRIDPAGVISDENVYSAPSANLADVWQWKSTDNAAYLPVYYFLYQAKVSIAEAISKLQEVESRYPAKTNVIKRLQRMETLAHGKLDADTDAASEKRRFKGLIKSKSVPTNLAGKELEDFLSAITHLSAKEIEWDYLSSLLREIFRTKFDTGSSSTAERLRKALCHLDHM